MEREREEMKRHPYSYIFIDRCLKAETVIKSSLLFRLRHPKRRRQPSLLSIEDEQDATVSSREGQLSSTGLVPGSTTMAMGSVSNRPSRAGEKITGLYSISTFGSFKCLKCSFNDSRPFTISQKKKKTT